MDPPLGGDLTDSTDDRRRRRLVLEFVGRFLNTPDHLRRALVVERPVPTGKRTWDALLGALAEHLSFHEAFDAPEWSTEANRFLDAPWYWVDLPSVRRRALTGALTALRVERCDSRRLRFRLPAAAYPDEPLPTRGLEFAADVLDS